MNFFYRMSKPLLFISFLAGVFTLVQAQPSNDDVQRRIADNLLQPELKRLSAVYHIDSAELAGYDKIITYDREVLVVKIYNITWSDIRYTYPLSRELHTIGRSRISQILYGDGRRDVFIPLDDRTVKQTELVDTARIIVKSQKDWMKVAVTEDPLLVERLNLMGNIKASYEATRGNADNNELMEGVGVILKKKAAVLKAHYVIIDSKFFYKAYGELPRVDVTARAFGYEEKQ